MHVIRLTLIFAVAVAGTVVKSAVPQTTYALVDLGYSKYQGTVLPGGTINEYLGIRYAAPPIGKSTSEAAFVRIS